MYSTVQFSTVQYSSVHYSTVQYRTVQYRTVQHSAFQYSTVSTVQFITPQYTTVQYSIEVCIGGKSVWNFPSSPGLVSCHISGCAGVISSSPKYCDDCDYKECRGCEVKEHMVRVRAVFVIWVCLLVESCGEKHCLCKPVMCVVKQWTVGLMWGGIGPVCMKFV